MQLSEVTPPSVPASRPRGARAGNVLISAGALGLLGGAAIDFFGGTLAGLGATGLTVLSWQSLLYYGGAAALLIGAQVRRRALRRRALEPRANGEL